VKIAAPQTKLFWEAGVLKGHKDLSVLSFQTRGRGVCGYGEVDRDTALGAE